LASADSALSVEGIQITLPGKVLDYAYHHPSRKILVSCAQGARDREFILYDLAKHEVQWVIKSNAAINTLQEKVAILDYLGDSRGPRILDAADGHFLREGGLGFWTTSHEDMALILTKDKYACVDLLTGQELWQRPGSECDGYRWARTADTNWVYVVANGLQAFQVDNGKGWSFETSTSSKAVGKEVAKHAGLAILGALTGTIPTADWDPDLTHNLCSYPVTINGRVYFAARDNVYCFERQTGKVLWQTKLVNEPGSLLVSDFGPYLAVIGEGWKYRNYNVHKALTPSLILFDLDSGERVAQFATDSSDVVLDFRWTEDAAYFLTSTRLYHLDHKLAILSAIERTPEWGPLVRILAAEDGRLTIRTFTGVAALDGSSLEVLWHKKLGSDKINREPGSNTKWKEGAKALMVRSADGRGFWRQNDLAWFAGGKGLTAVNLKQSGAIAMEIAFTGKDFNVTDEGILFITEESRLSLIDLNKLNGRKSALSQ
jgi:outer membrane protein assembly factor BamB